MKPLNLILALLTPLAFHSVSSAADQAWFSYEGPSGGDVVVYTEGPGETLLIGVQPGAGPVRIGYHFTNTYSNGMAGWAFQLNSNHTGVTFSGGANAGLGGYDAGFGGTSGSSSFFAGQSSIPGTGAAGLAYTFDLVIAPSVPFGTIFNVTGDYGPTEQYYGGGSGYAWAGTVGPNPLSYGRANYSADGNDGWGRLPVISVFYPNPAEPATLGLLAIGLVVSLRRNRSRRL